MSGYFLNVSTWSRRAAFDFFRTFEVPFFDICVEVDVSATRAWCRDAGRSFTWASWFAFQQAVNAAEPFRMRLRGDQVWVHDHVRVASTVLNPDRTFRYLHVPYNPGFAAFEGAAKAATRAPAPDSLDARPDDDAVVHGSVVPWLRFTGLQHARPKLISDDSVPKVVFGRISGLGGRDMMPLSVSAHHALVDGVHIGELVAGFEAILADPVSHLTG